MPRLKLFRTVTTTIKEHRAELRDLTGALATAGYSADEQIDAIVAAVDALIDWPTIGALAGPVGGAVGSIAELLDGPVAVALVRLIVRARKDK
jgi:hypothetical protein